jgi:hypothetical protein
MPGRRSSHQTRPGVPDVRSDAGGGGGHGGLTAEQRHNLRSIIRRILTRKPRRSAHRVFCRAAPCALRKERILGSVRRRHGRVMSLKATALRGRLADTPAGRHWAVFDGRRQRSAPMAGLPLSDPFD